MTVGSARGQDGLRGKESRLDRGPYAFTALRIRQASGIADQQYTVSGHVSFGMSVQKIRMAQHLRRQIKSNLPRLFQEGAEGGKVIGQGMGIESP
jgi:hypothetical protein